ncbi:conserved hypothetical protein [Trichinella spiralis]|uniref:hypothetical protein n=1 Tax=Trichinella spiralis TaxID=6334 RepID=UPI0001EFCCBB|nr:conserved hypothetical protein [Trichinella spiralis]
MSLPPLSTLFETFPLITERLQKVRRRDISSFNGSLPVVVVKGPRRSLLGKKWFKPLDIRLVGVHSVALSSVQDLIEEYSELFSDTLGTVKRPPVVLHTDGSIPPIQMNAMRVPFALKQRISEELDRLVE